MSLFAVLEVAVVLLLIVMNGLLAMSELAIISARSAQLKAMAHRGERGAATALRLAEDPGRFLSAVQIGITLVGVLSGAFSGATLGLRLTGVLTAAGLGPDLAQALGVGLVVVAITYLSLIVGELVPKQIALRAPERMAARVAPAMSFIALVAAPLVWLLDHSSQLVLRLLGPYGGGRRDLTDDEVRMVIAEARQAGVIKHAETEMIEGVMRIADRPARRLMTPLHEVELIDLSHAPSRILEQVRASPHSRLPVRDGDEDSIIGVLKSRDVLDLGEKAGLDALRALVLPPTVILESKAALSVIETLRRAPAHMVLVFDEYGHLEGLITAMDVLEAITGDFHDEGDDEPKVVERSDRSLLVAGWMPVDEFADRVGIVLPEERDYETVAGLILSRGGSLPEVGETLEIEGLRIEIVDLDGRRIDKILVTRTEPEAVSRT